LITETEGRSLSRDVNSLLHSPLRNIPTFLSWNLISSVTIILLRKTGSLLLPNLVSLRAYPYGVRPFKDRSAPVLLIDPGCWMFFPFFVLELFFLQAHSVLIRKTHYPQHFTLLLLIVFVLFLPFISYSLLVRLTLFYFLVCICFDFQTWISSSSKGYGPPHYLCPPRPGRSRALVESVPRSCFPYWCLRAAAGEALAVRNVSSSAQ